MTPQDTYKPLTEIFHDLFDDEALVLTPETTAQDVIGWNSLMHVNLILAVEEKFRIKFKASEIEAMHNVGNLASLVALKVDASGRNKAS